MADPRYPIGLPNLPAKLDATRRSAEIGRIAGLPEKLFHAVRGLDETQLDTCYRKGGWTLRQVVHHIGDSHINAYLRHKLTISEDMPTIPAYDEAAWAEMVDAKMPIGGSLAIVQGVHARLTQCLRSLPEEAFKRRAHHQTDGVRTLDDFVVMYAWHGEHHVAHITTLRKQKGW